LGIIKGESIMGADQASVHYTMKVDGGGTIDLKDLDAVLFKSDSPDDADAKSNSTSYILEVSGKIIQGVNEKETIKVAKWSTLPAGAKDIERKVTVELVKANKVVRQYIFSHAFVVDYSESIGEGGIGSFSLNLKQNRNLNNASVEIEGGFDK
jgi:hypothetical protein